MIYGKEKARDMGRSILPSKAKKWAKKKRQRISKRTRRAVNQDLWTEGGWEDVEEVRKVKTMYMVGDRREADKVNPLLRWAPKVVADISEIDARRATIKKILPKGVIGEHAFGHLKYRPEFSGKEPFTKADSKAAWAARRLREHEWRVNTILKVLAYSGGHKALNKALKHTRTMWSTTTSVGQVSVGPSCAPKILGVHDIEKFLGVLKGACNPMLVDVLNPENRKYLSQEDIRLVSMAVGQTRFMGDTKAKYLTNPMYHPEWLTSLDDFLRKWELVRGH